MLESRGVMESVEWVQQPHKWRHEQEVSLDFVDLAIAEGQLA